MRQILSRIGLATLTLALALSTGALAQDNTAGGAAPAPPLGDATNGKDQAQLQDAAKKAFQAIADSKLDDLWVLVENRYTRKLNPDRLRPGLTGPKVSVGFDGSVRVLRQTKKDAVVTANFFKPDSAELPATEVGRLNLFMVNDHGTWKIGAPDKREAAFDGDSGGWYHSGAFTFCPNKGITFLSNHFSSKTECDATAVCR